MPYDAFIKRVSSLLGRDAHKTLFRHDNGKHIARIHDISITGNTKSSKLTVKWGDGHVGMIDF